MKRKSLWPMTLVLVFVVFIAGLTWFIVFATQQRMDLVTPDYYAQEITYQEQIDREERGRAANQTLAVKYDADEKGIRVSLSPPDEAALVRGTIALYRPSNADQDRRFDLALNVEGVQFIPVHDLAGGLWKVRALWTVGGEEFFREENLVIP